MGNSPAGATVPSLAQAGELSAAGGHRDVRRDIHELSEKSIPLPEQDEIWQRIRRIEDHVGLPQELKAA